MINFPQDWDESLRTEAGEALQSGSMIAVKRALSSIQQHEEDGAQDRVFKLGIASTFVLDHSFDVIRLASHSLGTSLEIESADFDNIEQAILDPSSVLHEFKPSALLIVWRLEDLCPNLFFEYARYSSKERESLLNDVVARIKGICDQYLLQFHIPLFVSTIPSSQVLTGGNRDAHLPWGVRECIARLNLEIRGLTRSSSLVHIFDFETWAVQSGKSCFDFKMDLYAHQPIAARFLGSFAEELVRAITPLIRPSSKVLALDLDNTLWGGVLGEDLIEGLQIGQDFPGNIYYRIQLYAKSLQKQGVLLVLLSKNNLSDVQEAFAALSNMPLSFDDFSAHRVNWERKSVNIQSVAKELNLGLDSFVFIDDQPFEREEMTQMCPDVQTLGDSDPLALLTSLIECDQFEAYGLSDEDADRHKKYREQQHRKAHEDKSSSVDGFLRSLELELTLTPANSGNLSRIVQMLQKTNQFNLTTLRHSEADIRDMMAGDRNLIWTAALKDRFGNQGIIGLAIGLEGDDPNEMVVDSFLLSCRALSRGVEKALFAHVAGEAVKMGYTKLRASYFPTAKNGQVSDFYQTMGMTSVSVSDEKKEYEMPLTESQAFPDWLNIIVEGDKHG